MRPRLSSRRKVAAVVAATAVVIAPSAAVAGGRLFPPRPGTTVSVLPAGQDNPSIADGVAIGKNVALYKTSGLGPSALNTTAPAGSEARYIDTDVFPGGVLPAGVTITEAQGINVLAPHRGEPRQGRSLLRRRHHHAGVPAERRRSGADGLQRLEPRLPSVLRQHQPVDRSAGRRTAGIGGAGAADGGQPGPPSRFALEIENLPVNGWLVEVEVDAAYPSAEED